MTNNSLVDFMDASDAVNNSKHTLEDGTYWNWSNGVEIATTRAVAQFVAFTSVIIIHFVITFVNYKHRISESLILRFSLLFIDLFASLEAIKVLQQSQICFLFQATRILLEWAYAKLIAKTSLDKKEISITEILRRPLSVIAIIGVTSIIRSTSKTFLIFLKATWHLCLLYVFLKLWLVEKGWFHTFLASAQLLRLASFIGEHNVLKAPGPIKCELSLIGEASSAIIHNLYLTWSLWSDGTETIRRSQMSSSYRNPNILESKNFTFFVFIGLCTLPFVSESILYPPRVSEDCAKFQHILNSQTIEIIWLLLLTFKTSVGLVDGESSGMCTSHIDHDLMYILCIPLTELILNFQDRW
mmetsp:Transcript_14232/g.19786  ORF Transcript_14232/g.19786 Transcript_14232/m.19786 type:complete len:356 (+) Transcript_14232:175-1242(+)